MILSHRHVSLRFTRLLTLVQEALSSYSGKLWLLDKKDYCLSCQELREKRFLKERYWKFGIFMAAATTLPLLYRTVDFQELVNVVCAKASVSTSAKLLDNLNDEIHTYEEALRSLCAYKSALGEGVYVADDASDVRDARDARDARDVSMAEHSAYEIATWAHNTISRHSVNMFSKDVNQLVSGQVASLTHKKGKYPSMKEYLSTVCERSIGNVWIDMDLALLKNEASSLKEGNDYIFKSYLIYDDVQDIARDIRNNSVNAAVILGLERGILSEEEIKENTIIEDLGKAGVFRDLLWLGDLAFLKGLETISEFGNSMDKKGFKTSLGLIRMYNMRRILKREKSFAILGMVLASHKKLKRVKELAPEYIHEMVELL